MKDQIGQSVDIRPGDEWYFAYGSNMSIRRKETRTDAIRHAMRVRLPKYRLSFNKIHPVHVRCANIVVDDMHEVWGVLYLCDQEAMRDLDRCEGVEIGHYERCCVSVMAAGDAIFDATTYIACSEATGDEGIPSDEYCGLLLTGALEHDLPAWYIDEITRIARKVGK